MEVLKQRMEEAIAEVGKDERYVESLEAIKDIFYEQKMYDLKNMDDIKDNLCARLHEADGAYPMHPCVARLLIDIYEDGVDNKNADSMCDLGSLYYTGRAGEQDYKKAAYYYEMADKGGSRQGTENLGYIYYYGRTGEKDYEKAFKCFLKGALDGHIRSLYKIGDFYRNGYFVDSDLKEAFIIYNRCAETMTEDAIPLVGADVFMRLGDCYYEGLGVEKDLLTAQRFMSLAENLFYRRLKEGDFYQKSNLEHVLDVLGKIRKEMIEDSLPDLSWAGYKE